MSFNINFQLQRLRGVVGPGVEVAEKGEETLMGYWAVAEEGGSA